ncbi:MAG TPA: NapC/NirT family cytochrome c [Bacillota bacterium]|nr:NapC/NirT family cytochrome c [Bacillota bacterium]
MNLKLLKYKKPVLILLSIFAVLLLGEYLVLSGTYKAALHSQTCAKCHNMVPEYYTWQSSAHAKVECADCHVQPGTGNLIKYQVKMVGWVFKSLSGNYAAPIKMTEVIPDSACNKCHSMDYRNATPSGDLIIPHSVHKGQKVPCVKCHVGLAHGEIADRRVTFQADYARWSPELATTMMKDYKFVRPSMNTCTDCHRVKKGPMECGACHLSSMLPTDHKTSGFLGGGHGGAAVNRLDYCDSCHGYMSEEKVTGVEKEKSYVQFLKQEQQQGQGQAAGAGQKPGSTQKPGAGQQGDNGSQGGLSGLQTRTGQARQEQVTTKDYAAQNTFCRGCHSKTPVTHLKPEFMSEHGALAKPNQQRCLACHNNNGDSIGSVAGMACGTCHPSRHSEGWRTRHPIPLPIKTKITDQCTQCHVPSTCNSCHASRQKSPENHASQQEASGGKGAGETPENTAKAQ